MLLVSDKIEGSTEILQFLKLLNIGLSLHYFVKIIAIFFLFAISRFKLVGLHLNSDYRLIIITNEFIFLLILRVLRFLRFLRFLRNYMLSLLLSYHIANEISRFFFDWNFLVSVSNIKVKLWIDARWEFQLLSQLVQLHLPKFASLAEISLDLFILKVYLQSYVPVVR